MPFAWQSLLTVRCLVSKLEACQAICTGSKAFPTCCEVCSGCLHVNWKSHYLSFACSWTRCHCCEVDVTVSRLICWITWLGMHRSEGPWSAPKGSWGQEQDIQDQGWDWQEQKCFLYHRACAAWYQWCCAHAAILGLHLLRIVSFLFYWEQTGFEAGSITYEQEPQWGSRQHRSGWQAAFVDGMQAKLPLRNTCLCSVLVLRCKPGQYVGRSESFALEWYKNLCALLLKTYAHNNERAVRLFVHVKSENCNRIQSFSKKCKRFYIYEHCGLEHGLC